MPRAAAYNTQLPVRSKKMAVLDAIMGLSHRLDISG
jgi:hypothetical protein